MRTLLPATALALGLSLTAIGAPRELTPPPMGEDITVRVLRGGSVEIGLKAYEGRSNPLAYEIVREPRSGRLEDFRQADRNRQGFASVIYVHGDDEESTADEFAFRARTLMGGGVSSPIKVKVQIVDAPPRLGIDPTVNFSAVAGESDEQQIVVMNEGGGLLEGRLSPKEPFAIEGDGRFRLSRGEAKSLVVRFSPTSTDAIAPQKLSPAPGDPGATVILQGKATAPFSAVAEPMKLLDDGSRAGTITVNNLSSSRLSLEVTVIEPPGVADAAGKVKIGKGETNKQIPVTIGADKKSGALDLQVRVASPLFAQYLSMQAPVVPPKLAVLTREIDFRQRSDADLVVENTGGVEGRFSLALPENVVPNDAATNFAVAPGTKLKVSLRHEKGRESPAVPALVVDLGKAGTVEVPLLFPQPSPTPTPTPVGELGEFPTPTPAPMPWQLGKDVKLKSSSETTIITWRSAKSAWSHAQLEVIDETGPHPYGQEPKTKNWWETFIDWCFGGAAKATEAVEQNFTNRLNVPGEILPPEETNEQREPEWQEMEISQQDATNAYLRWQISARWKESEREPVSDEFRFDSGTLTEVTSPVVTAPLPPGGEDAQAIVPKAWSPTRDGATIIFEMPSNETVRDYRYERMQRFFGPDPVTGYPRLTYIGEPFDPADAETIERQPLLRDGNTYDVVTVRFSGIRPGTEVFWRAVPLAEEGVELSPSETLHFRTLPPWRFPWTSAALSGCVLALAALLFIRWKSRRASS